MATRKGSDNRFPLVRFTYEDDTPATPPSGEGHLVAGVDKVLRYIDDDGLTVELGAGTAITELDDVPDVNAPTPSNGDVLTWDSTPGEWVSAAPASPSAPTFVGARVRHSANQAISTATDTALSMDSERYDSDAFHDTSTNNTRLTVPSGKGGKYHIGGNILFNANATGSRYAMIRLNGSTVIARSQDISASGSYGARINLSCDYALAVGDYVELVVNQDSGGNLDSVAGANYAPEFWLHLIGA